jgi:hypothetical protein
MCFSFFVAALSECASSAGFVRQSAMHGNTEAQAKLGNVLAFKRMNKEERCEC